MSEEHDLTGLTALVTGATSGIGRASAQELARHGAEVIVHGRAAARGGEVTDMITADGGKARFIAADVTRPDELDSLVEQAGRVDILVNNAGTIHRDAAVDTTLDSWMQVLQVNLTSVFQLSQLFAKGVFGRDGKGKIVNIASLLSFQGGIRVPAYTASKGGVAQLTKALANEWAPKGIQVNAIAPGYFATTNTEALQADETRNRQILERIPAGRWGRPEDLAGAALFLASAASDYVTGTVVTVDGGWMGR
jgi:2-deoxy-D-gluconate 3-dehydrogenase